MPAPNPDNDNSIYLDVLKVLRELSDTIRANKDEQLDALAKMRDTTFRSINLLNHEVIGLIDQKKADDAQRTERQSQVDQKLDEIHDAQRQQRKWQIGRLIIESATAGIIVIVIIICAVLLILGQWQPWIR